MEGQLKWRPFPDVWPKYGRKVLLLDGNGDMHLASFWDKGVYPDMILPNVKKWAYPTLRDVDDWGWPTGVEYSKDFATEVGAEIEWAKEQQATWREWNKPLRERE